MFFSVYEKLKEFHAKEKEGLKPQEANLKENILLEDFLIHTRNLIDFIRGTNTKKEDYAEYPSDIVFYDFKKKNGSRFSRNELKLEGGEQKHKRSFMKLRKKINTYLSHLSSDRLEDKNKEWNCGLIVNDLSLSFSKFFNQVSLYYFPVKILSQELEQEDFKDLLRIEDLNGESSGSDSFIDNGTVTNTSSSQL